MNQEGTTAHRTGDSPEESVYTEPDIIRREEHCISRRDLDADALKVLYRLARNNYTAYLVGGGVRDLLLHRKPKDFDISTNARPEQIKSLFKNCLLIGRRFRLAHIRYGEKIIETSTFRRAPVCEADPNDPEADLFQRDDNLFGSPEEDALRRDFTINGLFYDIESFCVIDYVGGVHDLERREIRAIGDPGIRFREDPVRMVRAVRFASRLEFSIEEETLAALVRHRDEILKASPARLLEEITRLFAFSSGERAFRLLYSTGLLRVLFPEVADCLEETEDAEPFWNRLAALDRGDTVLPDATQAMIFAALFTDPIRHTLRGDRQAGNPGHNVERVRSCLAPITQRLKFPRKLSERLTRILLAQPRLLTPGKKRFSPAGLVQQEWFQEALALTEINASVDGLHQEVLNPWRVMLAEKLYAGDDSRQRGMPGGRQRRRGENRSPQPSSDAAGRPENGGADSQDKQALPGQGMSRSARRRRNRQKNREKRACEQTPVVEREVELPRDPVLPEMEACERQADGDGQPSGKRRRGRGRGKARKVKKAGGENGAEPSSEQEKHAESLNAGQVRPLTAAAFYTAPPPPSKPEPEPEAATKPARKRQSKAKKSAGVNGGNEDVAPPETERPRRVVDRAEEANTPMHWLDEI
ncbi:MAG: polynucleotide adenylyltransferase PcnB [Planctomycetota bacterium]|jgi:poly(A) polymerase|nr:polynucleotide adenylyltransferase PcnB [Planctomycetota bacterium]